MNRNAIETIKAKLPIESVVGSYVKLEKAGKNFRACCPFHNEKSPSFYVTTDRGIYYCYGCHKGGDIFSFVEEIEGIPFFDALKSLAEKAGVTLDNNQNEKPSQISLLREIMDSAAKHYEVGLRMNKGVVDYLLTRGMTKDTMVSFRIGYSEKGWSHLYNYLKKKNYLDDDLVASGLCIKGPKGVYDRFRERIMFPICDSQGRVIAFTGRVMPGTEESERPVGKYINSPETELYHKSSVLFAFDKAKTAIHTEGFAIIVEGQMDAVMSHQVGVTNVVALSGTASTDLHMAQIARFTTNIAICLDGDHAGLVAAQKTAMVAYQHNMKVLVIDIPESKDPADLIKEHPESWKEIVATRKDFISFRLEKMKQNEETGNKVAIAEKELFPILAHIQSQIVLDDRLQEIAHAFGSSTVDPIRQEFEKFRLHNPVIETVLPVPTQKKVISVQQQLLDRLVGILISMEHLDDFPTLKQDFERVVGPYATFVENKSEIEKQLMAFKADDHASKRSFQDFLVRYEISIIEQEKQQLDMKIMDTPQDADALKKVHELLMRKDALIRSLVNH